MKGGGWHILVSGGGGDRYPTGTPLVHVGRLQPCLQDECIGQRGT